jgi:hypothetical protein
MPTKERTNIERILRIILERAESPHIVIGPLVQILGEPHPHIVISTAKNGKWECAVVTFEDGDLRNRFIFALSEAAITDRDGMVIHDCDDELYAAELCETLWPGEEITGVRKRIEAERTRH